MLNSLTFTCMDNVGCLWLHIIETLIQNDINNKEICYINLTRSLKVGQILDRVASGYGSFSP